MLTALNFLPDWALVMILTYLVTLVTQFTSNTATASLMLPIVRSMVSTIIYYYYLIHVQTRLQSHPRSTLMSAPVDTINH